MQGYMTPRGMNSSFDVGVCFHLDLLARLGHTQHAELIFVLAVHHQLLQSY